MVMGSRVADGRTPFGFPDRSNFSSSAKDEATRRGSCETDDWMIAFARLVTAAIPPE